MKISRKLLGKKLFNFVMKSTFYGHFVAGECQNSIKGTIENMLKYNVKSILDYSVEEDLNASASQIIKGYFKFL
jgi:proline dehydrogenase